MDPGPQSQHQAGGGRFVPSRGSARKPHSLARFLYKSISLIMLLQFSPFPPFSPSTVHPSTLQHSPAPNLSSCLWVVFFEFSVSYTILDLSPSILCLPIMPLIPCTFPFHSPPPSLKNFRVISMSLILFLF